MAKANDPKKENVPRTKVWYVARRYSAFGLTPREEHYQDAIDYTDAVNKVNDLNAGITTDYRHVVGSKWV